MRIPNDSLHISTARMYGAVEGLDIDGIEQMQGCPARYKAYIDEGAKEPEIAGPSALVYGRMIHEALAMAEEKEIPLLPDALVRAWDTSLPPEMFAEAQGDLTRLLERGGQDLTCIYVEKALEMPLMEYDGRLITFGGRLDRIELDATDDGTIYFRDFKSNRSPTSYDELSGDVQFLGYGALIAANLPDLVPSMRYPARIVGIMEQLKFEPLQVEITPEDIEMFRAWATAVANKILSDDEAKPKLNRWCPGCTMKWDCAAWQGLPGEGATLLDRLHRVSTLDDRARLMHEAEPIITKLQKFVDEVKEEIRLAPGTYDGVEYSIADRWANVVNLPALHELMGADFYNVVNPVQKRIDDYAKRHPEKQHEIEGTRSRVVAGEKLKRSK